MHHPEVQRTNYRVGPHAYLGFGPLDGRGNTKFSLKSGPQKQNAAIQSGEAATLALAFPEIHQASIKSALWLMHHFGTLGGRSRNGWGSFSLTPATEPTPALIGELPTALGRDWRTALHLDWPHAIGRDERPLIWQTEPYADWQVLMRRLAEIKIGLRTQFKFSTGPNAPRPEARHWLSYPITNHSVQRWRERGRGDFRLPNSLRFKVREANGQLRGVIVHVPCAPPAAFDPDMQTIQTVWSRVHGFLDHPEQQLSRIPA